MANDHDIHTCGCDDCEAGYRRRYYGSDREYSEAKKEDKNSRLKDFSDKELKEELKKRKSK